VNERASKNRVCEGLFTRALDGVPAESALVFMITTRRSSYYFLSVISRGDDEGVAAALPQSAPRRVVPAALAVQIARFFYTQPQDTLGVDFPDWLSFLSARLPATEGLKESSCNLKTARAIGLTSRRRCWRGRMR